MGRSRIAAKVFPFLLAVFFLSFCAPLALAQSDLTKGSIAGVVRDDSGGVLPGATVQVTNKDTGLTRSSPTDRGGNYSFTLLPPGTYSVRAELPNFSLVEKTGVRVTLGETASIDFELEVSNVKEEVIVTAEAPVVETTKSDVSQVVNERQIETLPLNGRDFTDLVRLTPGTVDAGDGRVSVGGNRGIQNNFNIDGADSNSSFFGEERGGTRPSFTFSQAAIREFQVVSSSYNAQFGNATGGIINAITKSGTNEFHGTVFYFFRDDSFIEEDAFGRESPNFEQSQGGFNLGGPIVRDRLHFFTNYDLQRRDEDTSRIFRNLIGTPLDTAANRARLEALLGYSLQEEIGVCDRPAPAPCSGYVQTSDQDVLLVKFDLQASPNHLVTLRNNYSKYTGENGTSSFQTDGLSTNGLEENEFNSVVGSVSSVFGGNSANELILQYANEERPRTANSTRIPETVISRSFDAVLGQNNFLPNNLEEARYQLLDNFTLFLGEHALKAGVDYSHVEYDDLFFRFQAGSYIFNTWADFFADRPDEYTQAFSPNGGRVKFDVDYIAAYIQDEWKPTSRLTLNLGLRYELQQNPDGTLNPAFHQTGDIPDDTDNIAPRLGFAFDVEGNRKGVLRGGVGRFFNTTPTLLLANALLTNGVTVTRVNLRRSTGGTLPTGFPTYPNTIPSLGALPTVRPDLFVVEEDFENPETWKSSLGYEREVLKNFSAGVDFIYARGDNFERRWDINLFPAMGTTADGRPLYQTTTRPVAGFGRIIEFTSDAETEYTAAAVTLRKRFANRWQATLNYTWSDFKDHDTNERNVSSTGNVPMDMFDIDSNWGPSDYDVEHNVVLSGTVILPWEINFSLIGTYRTGRPYTAQDARDLNRDGMFVDRPTVDGRILGRNSFRQPDFKNLDVRLSKTFSFFKVVELELIGEAFNVTGESNKFTSRTQLIASNGTVRSDFGQLNVSGRPRQYQAGLRVRF